MYICAWQAPELPPDALISSRIDARRRDPEPGAAVLLRDQRREPAVLGQRADELLRVAVGLEPAPVLAREAVAELADRRADLVQLGRDRKSIQALRSSRRRAMTSCWISFEPSPISSSGASR